MPRPTVSEDTLDRLEEIADARAKVPAEHLSPEQKIAFLLDELEDADARANRLSDRVDRLEAKIKQLQADDGGSTGDGVRTTLNSGGGGGPNLGGGPGTR